MKHPHRPIATVWDMDGTIFDTERLQTEAWTIVCERYGFRDARKTFLKMIGRTTKDSIEIFKQDFGPDVDVMALREEKRKVLEGMKETHGIPIKPGARETLDWLKSRRIPTALASSTSYEKILAMLAHHNMSGYFSAIVGGDQIPENEGKPHPKIFRTAASKLRVDPALCIAFEDSLNGVISAHAAGMCVVMIPDLIEPTEEILQRVHHRLESLLEAPALLERLLGPAAYMFDRR